MILIGIGANLSSERFGSPRQACEAALKEIENQGIMIVRRSRWYRSRPVPVSDQPWYVNGVAELETNMEPKQLLELLHKVEEDFGRVRRLRNEARIIDLDLLAHGRRISSGGEGPILPHPRLAERAFVLLPLLEIAPGWRHPESGLTVRELVSALPPGQITEPDL